MANYPVSKRLNEDLERIISSTKSGDKLPSEPVLAKELGVSRATLREAMRIFEIQGRLRRRQGSGTYVTHPRQVIESGLEKLESIQTIADRLGLKMTLGKWRTDVRQPNEEEKKALGIAPRDHVLDVSRVINVESRPAAFLTDVLPLDILSPFELMNGFTGSVLDFILKRGYPSLLVSRTEINAVTATRQVARALGIQRGDALLSLCADLYDSEERIIDHSYSYFLPGYFNFHIVRRVG